MLAERLLSVQQPLDFDCLLKGCPISVAELVERQGLVPMRAPVKVGVEKPFLKSCLITPKPS